MDGQNPHYQKRIAEYQARQERLKRIAYDIDRSPNNKFYGADFHFGFNFMYGELMALQKEYNERFSEYMADDSRFAEFYDRIVQIMEASEIVLIDSICPVKNKQKTKKESDVK